MEYEQRNLSKAARINEVARKQLQMVWKLRRVLSGLAADGNAAPGLELLIDRLKTFRTNDHFLEEISKQPSM